MNSLPITNSSGMVSGTTAKFRSSAVHLKRRAARSSGSYIQAKNRETGLTDAGLRLRPRMKIVISTGTSVIESNDANTIAEVFVNASGLNMRPSCASSRQTGTHDTMMMVSAHDH